MPSVVKFVCVYLSAAPAGCLLYYLVVTTSASAQDPSGQAMKQLYREYLNSNEDWWTSTLIVRESQTSTSTEGDTNGYLTKAESRYCIDCSMFSLAYSSCFILG